MLLYQVYDFGFHNSVQPHIVKALSHVFLHKAVGFGDVFGANEVVVLRFLFIAVVIDEYVYQRGLVERLALLRFSLTISTTFERVIENTSQFPLYCSSPFSRPRRTVLHR